MADAIAVLHNISNAQLHAMATAHLGREPHEDEFEPSTWVMVREGFTTSGVAYADAIGAVHAQTRRFVAGMSGHDVLLVPTLLTPPPPYALLDQARGTTRAFFDVEFATTGWTSLANVDGLGGDLVAARRHFGRSADRSSADGARRDDPAPARRTARNGCAVGRSVAQYIVCCATSVS